MPMDRLEFEVLSFVEREGNGTYSLREISDRLCISGSAAARSVSSLRENGWLSGEGDELTITGSGLAALEPYRVKRAIILAAGFGSRMMPATASRPKPMVTVNGVRIIDTLLDALLAVGIRDIFLIGGYQYDVLTTELSAKYPFLHFLNNKKYAEENNISSAVLSMEYFRGGCYFCEADLLLSNPAVIRKYQYATNILGSWALETDDWCFKLTDGYLDDYKKGGERCYNYYGISYWTDADSSKLREDWVEAYNGPGGKDLFWEFPPLIYKKERYHIELRLCDKQDVMEIDNYSELALLDPSYRT